MSVFLRFPEVERRTGLRKSSIFQMMADGTFPRSVPITARARGWIEEEIQAWQDARIAARAKLEE